MIAPPWAKIVFYAALTAGLAGACYIVYDSIGDARQAKIEAQIEKEKAEKEIQVLQAKLKASQKINEISQQYIEQQNVIDQRVSVMLNGLPKPTKITTTIPSCKTLGDYANDLSADFGECRERLITVGKEGARASQAAWALSEAIDATNEQIETLNEKAID